MSLRPTLSPAAKVSSVNHSTDHEPPWLFKTHPCLLTVPRTKVKVTPGALRPGPAHVPSTKFPSYSFFSQFSTLQGCWLPRCFLNSSCSSPSSAFAHTVPPAPLVFLHLYPSLITRTHPARPSSSGICFAKLPQLLKPSEPLLPSVTTAPHPLCTWVVRKWPSCACPSPWLPGASTVVGHLCIVKAQDLTSSGCSWKKGTVNEEGKEEEWEGRLQVKYR